MVWILHIVSDKEWLNAKVQGIYMPIDFEKDGFIHCSTKEQIVEVANHLYKSMPGLVILCINSNKVTSKIIFDDLYDLGKLYPHIYGPLNIDAVLKVVPLIPNENGFFALPKEAENL